MSKSPAFTDRIHIAGESFWTSTDAGLIQQIDPVSGASIGHAWQLPGEDLPSNPKFVDWRLISASGDLWLLTGAAVTHLDIATVP